MLFATLIFSAFALVLAIMAWWIWAQRQYARQQAEILKQQAELLQKQAAVNDRLTDLGRQLHAIAHDLFDLFTIVCMCCDSARRLSDEELKHTLDIVRAATDSAVLMLRAMLSAGRPDIQIDTVCLIDLEATLRLAATMMQRAGESRIDLSIKGDLRGRGSCGTALRVVQNLLGNALEEARHIPGAGVHVELCDGELRISNPVRDPSLLGEHIYEEGTSGTGSGGYGLPIARHCAALLGWSISHELAGDRVTFIVRPGVWNHPLAAKADAMGLPPTAWQPGPRAEA